MAAIVSREEIDALLSRIQDGADESSTTKPDSQVVDASRVVRGIRPQPFRMTTRYVSPVIKAREIVFNPDPATTPPQDKVVVRTLGNYLRFQRLLRTSN